MSNPVVGQARINNYGLLKIALRTAPHAMGFGTAKPASDDGSGRHCNDPAPNRLMLGDPNSRVLLFSSKFIRRNQGCYAAVAPAR